MIKPELPKNEKQRLQALKNYDILDTGPEYDLDNITELTASICDVPIAIITLLDSERNFFKSRIGIDFNESPRELSFCGHAIIQDNPIFIIEDATKDERFYDNPIITENNVKFYAGVPLINPDGYALGTLCVYDSVPRQLNNTQQNALIILAKQVINVMELRLKNKISNEAFTDLKERHKTLKSFANKVSHDLKSPLANITSLSQLFKEELKENYPNIDLEYLNLIEESADTLRAYVDGILKHYKSEALLKKDRNKTKLEDVYKSIKTILSLNETNFKLLKKVTLKNVNTYVLEQILLNLVDNGFKYNFSESPIVTIDYDENETHHIFYVTDNGKGIDETKQDALFDIFKTAHETDKHGKKGTGIGLFTVKSLLKKLKGTITINSKLNEGTTFKFTILK
ncbi:sensor histidine kinase [Neotamlana laminarinivorans]|uniref:histidine kinase n=1 Tax=Neotamlana laminarinivorans TaxID=2883124 RepID=A0A9X1HXE5_9FLAO|nr:GAF domain-containing sensor histidine kinase [Tamlana laminarinivorans]MCB4797536.1 GAF domain-containing sensor histidine kinase [Tamlana laminarinivorans]